ncbi:murein L,D-transpeptidase catalytic domain family protein [Adhaeribacter rhizoryzae]|uniref:Murein L,D-transpeptidase catalytic domain family protein n=1 Tax=Adhaeribacter rhizoryzae TaxID=2607907 RepID=A0A5M6DJF4_9BACT|nr:murein L,D-transpeptidase catalytic domain family protein [Adhaeribacter rhizoryzae]KAA5547697.1 murein L,D-transpeptidase catalytic domain family protein [Adhaeribacter rhizoryzae]
MKRYTVLSAAFILFAFTKPAVSQSPGTALHQPALAAVNTVPIKATKPVKAELLAEEAFEDYLKDSFDRMDLRGKGLKLAIYRKAVIGFHNLKRSKKVSASKSILSIVDFSKSSRQKRLWIIDLKNEKLLYHTLVAHGQGSGAEMATVFSNKLNSHQSSLGFYVTGNTYFGKHGLSLKLHGMDTGFNSNAYQRAIVVHGADYVSNNFIKQQGRLGRSHGCPAVPQELNKKIIEVIKNQTVLYIDADVNTYASVYLNKSGALAQYAAEHKIFPSSNQASI